MKEKEKKKRFAVFLIVSDVAGGGGVERLFINFIRLHHAAAKQVDIITTKQSREIILRLFPDVPANQVKAFPVVSNRFSHFISGAYISAFMLRHRYSLVHIANFDFYYVPLYQRLSRMTRLTLNIIDCRFAPEFNDARYNAIKQFIASGCLSGIVSWYENAKDRIHHLSPQLPFYAAQFCFTDYSNFKKEKKEQVLVFASRLIPSKRPGHYLQAVKLCIAKDPALAGTWKFLLWGDGEMKEEIQKEIEALGLKEIVITGFSADMSKIFNSSSVFVSTQLYENFTSLSMLEAMASGNAIVSYNLGQTGLFVQDGVNGKLVPEETPEALAAVLGDLLRSPSALLAYQEKSAAMARQIHTVENFSKELFSFWNSLPARS